MKLLLFTTLLLANLHAIGEDTLEALYLCESADQSRLITIVHQTDNPSDRALFINSWDNLTDDSQEFLVPIQDPNSFQSVDALTTWLKHVTGPTVCNPISYEEVELHLKNLEENTP